MRPGLLSAGVFLLSTSMTFADIFGTGPNQFSIDFVNIGHAGNNSDPLTGYGSVDHSYRIGKYEITIDQFMKAYAADSRLGDGNENRWNDGIRTVGGNAPASRVSWFETAMFCNWLTSGDVYDGAYQFNASGVLTAIDRASAISAHGTVYVIPTENEWYKAAYYKPINDGSYALYASGLDATPVHGTTNGWNYYNGGSVNSDPNYVWEVGYGGSEQNRTYDMMGNVQEWTESAEDGVLDDLFERRVNRGGGITSLELQLSTAGRLDEGPTEFSSTIGFRVAAIPEPSSILLLTIGAGGVFFYRRATSHQMRRKPGSRQVFD